MSFEYDFDERLGMSHGVSANKSVKTILLDNIPGAHSVELASKSEDRHGTDWWVLLRSGHKLSVDVKVRQKDCRDSYGADDLALETWSVIEQNKIGWTRDPSKRTDYILWVWMSSGRWTLIPFHYLIGVFVRMWEIWVKKYKVARQRTPFNGGEYQSECVFVPRQEVWREIYTQYSGRFKANKTDVAKTNKQWIIDYSNTIKE